MQGDPANPTSDQWLDSFVIVDENGSPVGTVQDGDAVVLFNFRADRVVEISKAFEYEDFASFDRKRFPKVHCYIVCCATLLYRLSIILITNDNGVIQHRSLYTWFCNISYMYRRRHR